LTTQNRKSRRCFLPQRKEIEQERRQMVKEVKNEVAGLAFAAASKVVSANMDTKDNRELVEQFLDQMGAA
jgi:F-type H+-transporting ATPase subunit b